jgi:hypothetical protein
MKRLLPLALLPLLAACEVPPDEAGATSARGRIASLLDRPEAEPAPLPPQVLAALPSGVPPTVVTRNADGCYLLTIEVTTPPTGYPLRDAAGTPVCDGDATVAQADLAAAPPASGTITPPAPLAPLNPG